MNTRAMQQIMARGALSVLVTVLAGSTSALGQALDEKFNTVTGSGGGVFFSGAGVGASDDWDTGITGENAFARTAGYAHIGAATAVGLPGGGVGGSGAGQIGIAGVTYDVLNENFNGVTGVGGATFLVGDGTPNTFNFTLNWDDGIVGEGAFGGTFDGAVLLGNMAARGFTTGGVGNSGRGQLRVTNVQNNAGNWFAGLQWEIGALPGGTPLLNPGFENGLQSWNVYGPGFNVSSVTAMGGPPAVIPRTGNALLKMFGQFTGAPNESGIFQTLPAQANQVWQVDAFSRHNGDDSLANTQNFVLMRLEFVDAGGAILATSQATILDAASPIDTWIDNAPLQATAPAGTTGARAVVAFSQPGQGIFEGGAGHVDDVSLKQVGGPGGVNLGNFSLTTSVRGTASGGAGEVLGAYQLRIEDNDGNRLFFRANADGNYQTIGGLLSTATEADASGTPASGVFDRNSLRYVVVVAFDTPAQPWGTGGTLDVDGLQLSNANPAGSAWFGGLDWDGLTLPPGSQPDELTLRADIKGSVPGGAYQLRLQGFAITEAGLDESFDSVTGVGGGTFLNETDVANGTTFGFDNDWDTGIAGEGAFGGIVGNAEIFTGGGFSAQGLVGGGATGGGGEVRVLDIITGPGGTWFGGMSWGNQGLASTDLSQVTLSANVRGLAQAGGSFGVYELRIEDAQGDRLYFDVTADGTWQTVGGPLSTATEGPRLGGGGDGTFNLDSTSYTVALSFIDPQVTWGFGGTLQIDDLFLSPITVRSEVGRVTFDGVSNGSFQSVGGVLSSGVSSFGDATQNFSTVTGAGAGVNGPWDTGLTNETSFFGTFGNAANNGGAIAQGCTTCGVNGSGAGQIIVNNVVPNAGGWFAGLVFTNIRGKLNGDLSQTFLRAKIRGSANADAGESLGTFIFRVEDADVTSLQFEIPADGSFQDAGGALSTAQIVQIDQGDGVFNFNQATYSVTVAFVGTATNWGNGGTLTIDDIFLTGVQLDDADEFTATVTFADETATWGSAGALTVDNLFLGPATCTGDVNNSGAVDLSDLTQLLSHFGTASGASSTDGDNDGDGDVDLSDLTLLLANFGTICN